jgi:hypothetical protein
MTPAPLADPIGAEARPQPLWRRLLPFGLAIALIAFVVSRLDYRAFVAHLAAVNAKAFLLFGVVFVLALLSADTFATVIVYRRTIAKVRLRDFWILRGASSLPSLLNHHLGQAFITYFLSRGYGVPLARVAGTTLLVYASWMGCLLGFGSVAIWLNHKPLGWIAVVLGTGVLYLIVLAVRPARLARTKLLAPLFEAGISGHLIALAARIPHFIVLFLGTWVPFLFFGIDIPIAAAVVSIPILMVVVTLPLTPQGFGSRELVAAFFFERFAPGATHDERLAALAAATMSWGVVFTLVEAVIGLLLLRRAMPHLERERAPEGSTSREV